MKTTHFNSRVGMLEADGGKLATSEWVLMDLVGVSGYSAWSLSGEMGAFFSNGALHQQHQKCECNGNHRENQERVEIGKS